MYDSTRIIGENQFNKALVSITELQIRGGIEAKSEIISLISQQKQML